MIEKDMQTLFTAFVKTHLPRESEAYELKICKGKALPFSNLQPHQEIALLKAETTGFYHKLTDPPIFYGGKTRFNIKRPFDCFALAGIKSFVVIWYYHKGKAKVFIKIPIQVFIQERNNSIRKSLTEERAYQIGKPLFIK